MESITESLLSNLASLKTILGVGAAGGAILASLGTLPKVGVGRALVVGIKSLFSTLSSESVRTKQIRALKSDLENLPKGKYILITGGKGYGKSCMIDTCLHRTFGVVKVGVRYPI